VAKILPKRLIGRFQVAGATPWMVKAEEEYQRMISLYLRFPSLRRRQRIG